MKHTRSICSAKSSLTYPATTAMKKLKHVCASVLFAVMLMICMTLLFSACFNKKTGSVSSTGTRGNAQPTEGTHQTEILNAQVESNWGYDDEGTGKNVSAGTAVSSTGGTSSRAGVNGNSAETKETKTASESSSNVSTPASSDAVGDIYTSKPTGFIF